MADTKVNPQPWLWVMRPGPVQMICTHATRGATTPDKQFSATVNWMESPNNVGARHPDGSPAWGSSCSKILGRDGIVGHVLNDNQSTTYGAGFGNWGPGMYWVGQYAIEWEWCQSANREDFTTEQYERGAKEYALTCLKYGIPVTHVALRPQLEPAPRGLTRHDRTANGAKLGKTDPGLKFHEHDFEDLIRQQIHQLTRPDEPDEEEESEDDMVIFIKPEGRPEVFELLSGRHITNEAEFKALKEVITDAGGTYTLKVLRRGHALWKTGRFEFPNGMPVEYLS